MEYLTTAEIGLEAEIAHRVNGEAGIRYWAAASEGADVGLLKARLLQMPLSAAAKDFLSKASDEQSGLSCSRDYVGDAGSPGLSTCGEGSWIKPAPTAVERANRSSTRIAS